MEDKISTIITRKQARFLKKDVLIRTMLVALLSLFIFCLNTYAEQMYNPYTKKWETTSEDAEIEYDPYAGTHSYQPKGSKLEYNPFSGKHEWVPPSQTQTSQTQKQDMNNFATELLKQGYTLPGAPQKTIVEEGGEPGYYDTSTTGRMLRGLEKYQKEQQDKEDKELDRRYKAVKFYKELVDSGYPPKQAWEVALKELGFPPPKEE